MRIATNATGRMTWNGTSYLVIYQQNGKSFFQLTLDADGHPLTPATPIDFENAPLDIASNGRTILGIQQFGGVIVRPLFGPALSTVTFSDAFIRASAPVVLPDGDYAFLVTPDSCSRSGGTVPLTFVVVDGTTGAMTQRVLTSVPLWTPVALASDGARFLVARDGFYSIIDRDGNVLDSASVPALHPVAAGWDGRDFLVMSGGDSALTGYRVGARTSFTLPATDATDVHIARSETTIAAVWSERLDPNLHAVARTAADFDSLPDAPKKVVAISAQPQDSPRVAPGGALAVWREQTDLIAQAIGSPPETVVSAAAYTAPAIARGPNGYLTAWGTVNGAYLLIEARRIADSGTPLDRAPPMRTAPRSATCALPTSRGTAVSVAPSSARSTASARSRSIARRRLRPSSASRTSR